MYLYFSGYDDSASAPSFDKFARQIGVSLAELSSFREHKKFDRAYLECSEIRRDYLIDRALTRRFDPSFIKFLLEFERDFENEADEPFVVRLEVLE